MATAADVDMRSWTVQSSSPIRTGLYPNSVRPSHSFTHYINATTGNDSNDGLTSGTAWASISHALANAPDGSVISVANGSYGDISETSASRTDYLHFVAESASAVLGSVSLSYASPSNAYIKLDGFGITKSNTETLATLINGNFITIQNCEFYAPAWYYGTSPTANTVTGMAADTCTNLDINNNKFSTLGRGIQVADCPAVQIVRNFIKVQGSTAIQYLGGNTGGLIYANHISGENWTDPEGISPHQSAISIRDSNLTIRGNIIHGLGTSSGIMTYTPDAAGGEASYDNITIENNLIYNISQSSLRFYNAGSNLVIKNNLISRKLRLNGACPDGTVSGESYRYYSAIVVHGYGTNGAGSELSLYNNIVIGQVDVPAATTNQAGNHLWAYYVNSVRQTSLAGSVLLVGASESNTCGIYNEDFDDGTYFTTLLDHSYTGDDDLIVDFSYAASSPANGYGNVANQATETLGSLNASGFINDDGRTRSASDNNAGVY